MITEIITDYRCFDEENNYDDLMNDDGDNWND